MRWFHHLSSWWDAGKTRLKRVIREFSRKKSKSVRQSIKSHNAVVCHLQRRVDNGDQVSLELDEAKADLGTALRADARGAQVRARIRWAEEGESSTAYFLRQEKVLGQKRLISEIKRPDGTTASSTLGILRVWRNYYFSLFSSEPLEESAQREFLEKLERHLSPSEAELCEGGLTEHECKLALQQMATKKAPGLDGLPAEFYVRFGGLLGADLVYSV